MQVIRVPVVYSRSCKTTADQTSGFLQFRRTGESDPGVFHDVALYVMADVGDGVSGYLEVTPESLGAVTTKLFRRVDDVNGSGAFHGDFYDASACFKWGHPRTIRLRRRHISVPAEDDPLERMLRDLGVHAARDLVFELSAASSSGDRTGPRRAEPARAAAVTSSGCLCREEWEFAGEVFRGTCGNPDGDDRGAWCMVESGTCAHAERDYCNPSKTSQGCTCKKARLPKYRDALQ